MNFVIDLPLLTNLINKPQDFIIPTTCELPIEWKNFQKELGNFKLQFKKARVELAEKSQLLNELKKVVETTSIFIDEINSEIIRNGVDELVKKYIDESDIDSIEKECASLAGKVDAMREVLLETNPEDYDQFKCITCSTAHVQLLFQPCKHLIMCEQCFIHMQSKTCPICRENIQRIDKVYTA